jgi:hypothetical protein
MRTYINREDTNKGLCDPTNKLLRFFLLSFSSWEKERDGEGRGKDLDESRAEKEKRSQVKVFQLKNTEKLSSDSTETAFNVLLRFTLFRQKEKYILLYL